MEYINSPQIQVEFLKTVADAAIKRHDVAALRRYVDNLINLRDEFIRTDEPTAHYIDAWALFYTEVADRL